MALAARFLKERMRGGKDDKNGSNGIDTTSILQEVNLDFGRTMNWIIIDKTMEKTQDKLKDIIQANLTLPPKAPGRAVPQFGMVPIPAHDFPEQFSNFCFNSLFIKEEVIRAMVDIRAECNTLLQDNRIYDVSIKGKTLRVEEFKQIQASSIAQIKYNTQEQGWVGRLEKIIRASFTEVGKGWFNIYETSKETYEFGKLKKFLTLVNFMMQDTILTLGKDSVRHFEAFMMQYIPKETYVKSTSHVINIFDKHKQAAKILEGHPEEDAAAPEDIPESEMTHTQKVRKALDQDFAKEKDPEPLFVLDLILKPNQLIPNYSVEPRDIVNKVMEVFDEGIECLQQVPQLEPILLRHLFKTHGKKMLKAPLRPREEPKRMAEDPSNKKFMPDENIWLWDSYSNIKRCLEKSIEPLYEYVKTFSRFEGENKLNPDKFVKSLDEGEQPILADGLKNDIMEHRKEEERLRKEIPEFVTVSIFQINCKDIRNLYVGKHTQIIEKEVKLIS